MLVIREVGSAMSDGGLTTANHDCQTDGRESENRGMNLVRCSDCSTWAYAAELHRDWPTR